MNNTKLVENTMNELTYAESILNMIVNNDVKADSSLFNSIESVVENISRAKKNVCNINTDNSKNIGDIEISKDQTIETVIGSILTTLETVITLKVAEESGHLKNQDEYVINLINAAKLNLDMVYTKVSFPEC
ncbi:hypothetical protein J9231_11330 [Providencia rettgeri]|uniref:Uncharacterized protein n=1 Tax=Providencia rettgeri TaxID=587 RepID=A0A264VWJ5_PRORE|nr:hypothetical protein [Providencia rettgeri]MBQ0328440.1 hypothetical protein [Providencia rettgeri]OZS75736.1 hypothetical protein CHI95_05510 [Providencia rettgeri]